MKHKRINPIVADLVREYFGSCPACASLNANSLGQQFGGNRAAIYRRSNRSVTLRCHFCCLQWTLTWVQINKSLRHFARSAHVTPSSWNPSWQLSARLEEVELVIRATDRAVSRERRGRPAVESTSAGPLPLLRRDAA